MPSEIIILLNKYLESFVGSVIWFLTRVITGNVMAGDKKENSAAIDLCIELRALG